MTYQNLRYAAQKNTELQTLKQDMSLNRQQTVSHISRHTQCMRGAVGRGCLEWVCVMHCIAQATAISLSVLINSTEPVGSRKTLLADDTQK